MALTRSGLLGSITPYATNDLVDVLGYTNQADVPLTRYRCLGNVQNVSGGQSESWTPRKR